MINEESLGSRVAVVGMSGRFPGASSVGEFWKNLLDGVESIRRLSVDELRNAGIDQAVLDDPQYVRASAFIDYPDAFDAPFFGMSHREAEITDPQHRVLLECAWSALEEAGYNPANTPGVVGVFAGATINTYALLNLAANPEAVSGLDEVQLNIGNASDFLATRIAYKLNLRGPTFTVQSACSTSLVAAHIACESLLDGECDMALAGGASINVGMMRGYRNLDGGMASPDGRCRPFDADGRGTIFGSGVGMVVLKRLKDAIADGDHIWAIILGSAVNNDGSLKVGYTAPSVEGQAQVIAEALANAGVDASTISYVEAHGTATTIGDPIEIQALTKAFRAYSEASGYCAIGSVKSNIGHLDAAAGVAGLIKTVLALKHRQLPPTLHFRRPNPNIDFATSPFYVNTSLSEWEPRAGTRRAGVSAFGVGGTNAHIVLQEAPAFEPNGPSRPWQLISFSARTESSLSNMADSLASWFADHVDQELGDIAYTLHTGRQAMLHRRFVIASDVPDAITALQTPDRIFGGVRDPKRKEPPVTFMFPGQGSQYANMGKELYEREPLFRAEIQRCGDILSSRFGFGLLAALYPESEGESGAFDELEETSVAQPTLFAVEYALARLWLSWGIRPSALAGHSVGEYVAACLAGVFTLEDAIAFVFARGRLMQDLPAGGMAAVPLSEFELETFLDSELGIAAINGPNRCTVSGTHQAIERFGTRLESEGISFRRLRVSHAFHSPAMEPAVMPFADLVAGCKLRPPELPFLSNLTGRWIRPEEATDPDYWARHIRGTVRFSDNLAEMLAEEDAVLLELGPGQTLVRLARQHPANKTKQSLLSVLPNAGKDVVDALNALGRLWVAGVEPDWAAFYRNERRHRLSLPTYPFERERYWIGPARRQATPQTSAAEINRRDAMDEWFYVPCWRRVLAHKPDPGVIAADPRSWLLFADELGLAAAVGRELKSLGKSVIMVHRDSSFTFRDGVCGLDDSSSEGYQSLVRALCETGQQKAVILHMWSLTGQGESLSFGEAQQRGFHSVIKLVQAFGRVPDGEQVDLQIVSNHLFALTPNEPLAPEKATMLGVAKVVDYEYPQIRIQVLDIDLAKALADQRVAAEIVSAAAGPGRRFLAQRGRWRWEQSCQRLSIPQAPMTILRNRGVYLITGGLLEIGIDLAEHLAESLSARLVLVEEPSFPAVEEWERWLIAHGPSNTVSQRIRQARRLVDLGAEVAVVPVDIADPDAVQEAVAFTLERFGGLNGVIHNARVLGDRSFCDIEQTAITESEWQFAPKARGALNIARAVSGQPLDFCVLNSSLSSILGGTGMVSYAAANCFLDAFAAQQSRVNSTRWVSVNWDAWKNTQMSTISPEWAYVALSRDEGMAALTRILAAEGVDQVIVSAIDLEGRIKLTRERIGMTRRRAIENPKRGLRARPQLQVAYVAPGTSRERAIAEVWEQALGIEGIGALDNFFDLGGESLLAVQTASQLKKVFQMEIPVVSLYEGLTVRSLGKLLDDLQREQEMRRADEISEKETRRDRSLERRMLLEQQRVRRSGATGRAQ